MHLEKIGPYRILNRLGSGGMSSVYRAIGPDQVQVAVKLLQPNLAEDPQARLRLEREASVINRVKSTGIASVLDVNTEAELPYMVMELVHGLTLDKDVVKNGIWELSDLIDLAEWLARILKQLHEAQVLHRDIKPSNIMISRNGPVLIDFGISQLNDDDRLTKTGLLTGTTGYLSPQLHQGESPSEADDWWAWLCVLLFCSTGRLPFGGGNIASVSQRVLNGEADLIGLSEPLTQIFQVGFNPDITARPNAHEIIKALHRVANGEPLPGLFITDSTRVIGVQDSTALLTPMAINGVKTDSINTVNSEIQNPISQPDSMKQEQESERYEKVKIGFTSRQTLDTHSSEVKEDRDPQTVFTATGSCSDTDANTTMVVDTETESLVGRQAVSTHSHGFFPSRGIKIRSSEASFSANSEANSEHIADSYAQNLAATRLHEDSPNWSPSPSDFDRVVAAAKAAQSVNQITTKAEERKRRKYRLQRFFVWLALLCFGIFFFDFGIGSPIGTMLLQLGVGSHIQEFSGFFIFNHELSLLQFIFILITAFNLLCLLLLVQLNRKLK